MALLCLRIALFSIIALGSGFIMPLKNPNGSIDLQSLASHVTFVEQRLEGDLSTTEIASLKTQLKSALDDLKHMQSDLKDSQNKIAVLQFQLSSSHPSQQSSDIASIKADVDSLKASFNNQCPCSVPGSSHSPTTAGLQVDVSNLKTDVIHLKSLWNQSVSNGGATYTRWARTVCPSGSNMVYKGFTAGSYYTTSHTSNSKTLCLPERPIYGEHTEIDSGARLYGTEYDESGNSKFKNLINEDMPCVVCKSEEKKVAIMLPARNQCYPGWHLEYSGYLMGAYYGFDSASEHICADGDPETVMGGHDDKNGQLLRILNAQCGSLPCPPYHSNWELTCAVCSQ